MKTTAPTLEFFNRYRFHAFFAAVVLGTLVILFLGFTDGGGPWGPRLTAVLISLLVVTAFAHITYDSGSTEFFIKAGLTGALALTGGPLAAILCGVRLTANQEFNCFMALTSAVAVSAIASIHFYQNSKAQRCSRLWRSVATFLVGTGVFVAGTCHGGDHSLLHAFEIEFPTVHWIATARFMLTLAMIVAFILATVYGGFVEFLNPVKLAREDEPQPEAMLGQAQGNPFQVRARYMGASLVRVLRFLARRAVIFARTCASELVFRCRTEFSNPGALRAYLEIFSTVAAVIAMGLIIPRLADRLLEYNHLEEARFALKSSAVSSSLAISGLAGGAFLTVWCLAAALRGFAAVSERFAETTVLLMAIWSTAGIMAWIGSLALETNQVYLPGFYSAALFLLIGYALWKGPRHPEPVETDATWKAST